MHVTTRDIIIDNFTDMARAGFATSAFIALGLTIARWAGFAPEVVAIAAVIAYGGCYAALGVFIRWLCNRYAE